MPHVGLNIKIIIFFFLLITNILLVKSSGTGDVQVWIRMISIFQTKTYSEFFLNCQDYACINFFHYPPVFFIIFFILTKLLPVNLIGTFLTAKLIIFLFYLLTLMCLLIFNRGLKRNNLKVIDVVLIYFTTLSIILNTQALGYTDIVFAPFLILSLVCIYRNSFYWAGVLFGLSFLIKWQPLIILPSIIVYLIKLHSAPKRIIPTLSKFIFGIITPILVLFSINHNILKTLYTSLSIALNDRFLSAALNFPWIVSTFLQKDMGIEYVTIEHVSNPIALFYIPKIVFLALTVIFSILFLRKPISNNRSFESFLLNALMIYTSYFMITTGVHENHLIIAVLLSLLIFIAHPSFPNRILLAVVDLVALLNMFLFYGISGKQLISRMIAGSDITLIAATLFSLLYVLYFVRILLEYTKSHV